MTKIIEEPKVDKLEKVVFNPMVKHQTNGHPEVLRIENEAEFTRIDFIYYAKPYYLNGGWVGIAGDTFIRTVSTKERLTLVKAVNIPITPSRHFFKSTKEFLCYTLYFPPVPKGTKSIDIIEGLGGDNSWFNFYGVSMDTVRKERIIVGS